MYVSILNYQLGEIQIIEYPNDASEEETDENAIQTKLGHSDFHYMTSEKLILIINNER
jgi:hypothetical protein